MSKSKRLLCWKPNWAERGKGGRWYKTVNAKVVYFGNADSPDDTRAYRLAEDAYLAFREKMEAKKPVQIPVAKATVTDICEAFVQHTATRHERGEVCANQVDKYRWNLNDFAAAVGTGKKFSCVGELDLETFKNHLLSLPVSDKTGRKISRETAKGTLTVVRAMYRWAWKMRLIDSLPRNIDDLTKFQNGNGSSEPKVKTFTLDELKTLWTNAISRTRCFMALALNCGMGQKDISDLRCDDVDWENGYVERDRSKTGVRARHKLWPVTLTLLKKHRHKGSTGSDRVFLTTIRQKKFKTGEEAQHEPLVRQELRDGRLTKSNAITNAFWRLLNKTGIGGGRSFYCLRKTGASLIEVIDPLATEMYLSHSERGMKRNYAQRDWARLERATDAMWEQLKDVLK